MRDTHGLPINMQKYITQFDNNNIDTNQVLIFN